MAHTAGWVIQERLYEAVVIGKLRKKAHHCVGKTEGQKEVIPGEFRPGDNAGI